CQKIGHIAHACPHLRDPSARTCLRCGGNHSPKECLCPQKSKCTSPRDCRHIKLRCANCNGEHKAIDKRCPVLARARLELESRFDNGTPYYN
ncbi:hypothetical protein GGG16DRAFT_33460, partial [Schizophyllum commune]